MDRVCDDRTPAILTRSRDRAVVMRSLADYEALEETAHLLKNPRNAGRILSAIAQPDAGRGTARACPRRMKRQPVFADGAGYGDCRARDCLVPDCA